jgi:uncharacterized phage protein (TIGR02216 family)
MQKYGEGAARLSGVVALLLGWRPHEFWAATPAELALALQSPDFDASPPDRTAIDALRQRFPDE